MSSGDPSPQEASLHDIAGTIRRIYLLALQDSIGRAETNGACFYACILLQQAVERFSAMTALIRGGDGESDGGYFDSNGRGHGHYWVEARAGNTSAWVVDITADQFGDSDLVVISLAESAKKYRPGNQARVDGHISEHGINT